MKLFCAKTDWNINTVVKKAIIRFGLLKTGMVINLANSKVSKQVPERYAKMIRLVRGVPVLKGLQVISRFEGAAECAYRFEACIHGNILYRQAGSPEQGSGLFQPDADKVLMWCAGECSPELPHQLRNGKMCNGADLLQVKLFMEGGVEQVPGHANAFVQLMSCACFDGVDAGFPFQVGPVCSNEIFK